MTNQITQWNRMASAKAVERQVADRSSPDKGEAEPARASLAPADDTLELSPLARQQPTSQAEDVPFDRAKVDAIKQALREGQYPLNPRRMAESFLSLEQLISE